MGLAARRRLVRTMASGLAISVVLLMASYLLLATGHPAYAEGFGLSLLAVLGFVVGFAVLLAPRLSFLTSMAILQICFVWTSHLLSDISLPLDAALGRVLDTEASFFWNSGHVASLFPSKMADYSPMNLMVDLEVLATLAVLMASVFVLYRTRGTRIAILRSTQVAALSLVVLEVELALLDCSEFFIHVTVFQLAFNFTAWFTNADMLLSAFAVLATSTLLLKRSWPGSPNPGRLVTFEHAKNSRRPLGRFLILFVFGTLLVAGGFTVGYYGGVWRLSYSSAAGTAGDNGVVGAASPSTHNILTSYSYCQSQVRTLSSLVNSPSCGLESLNLGELAFVAIGGISILLGVFALRGPPRLLAERIDRLRSLLARSVPSLGRAIGRVSAWERDHASRTTMVLLSVEVLLGVALVVSGASILGFLRIPAACVPATPYGF